jgi:hypothetical protein
LGSFRAFEQLPARRFSRVFCANSSIILSVVLPESERSFDVKTKRGDPNGTAVTVVAGIPYPLQIRCERKSAPGVEVIVGLDNLLSTVVQRPVAEEKTVPP